MKSLIERILWFAIGGLCSTAANFAIYEFLFCFLGLATWVALALSLTIVTIFLSIWNYRVNFRTDKKWIDCLPKFLAVVLSGWSLSYLLTLLGISELGRTSVERFFVFLFVQGGVSLLKFFLYHFYVYPVKKTCND